MSVSGLASQPHYAAHLVPLWLALPDSARGVFYVAGKAVADEARRLGVPEHELASARTIRGTGRGEGPWLVAGFVDLERLGPKRSAVFVEHGTGQTYIGNGHAGHYPGGPGRGRVVLFVCPNQRVADANAAAYPKADVALTGCPHVERLAEYRALHGPYREQVPVATFHFDASSRVAPEARSAWAEYRRAMPDAVDTFDLAGHAHPRSWARLGPWWRSIGADAIRDQDEALAVASVLVADNTSCLFQAAALGIPVVVLNASFYRRHVQHGLRFWSHASVGAQVDGPGALLGAIERTLTDDPLSERREAIAEELYPTVPGGAARAAAEAVLALPGAVG